MSSINLKAYNLAKKYPFFKIFFLFYNVYIRNLKFYFKSSQFDEDLKILNLFEKNYKGNFIDLGCFHPTRQNNTFKLYKRGWRGINIDLNALTIDLFNFARPGDINICAAISNSRSNKNQETVSVVAENTCINCSAERFSMNVCSRAAYSSIKKRSTFKNSKE